MIACFLTLFWSVERDLSVRFERYMPHNSFLLHDTEAVAHRILEHEQTLWVGAFVPEYKVIFFINVPMISLKSVLDCFYFDARRC